jgi:hypothetical protein
MAFSSPFAGTRKNNPFTTLPEGEVKLLEVPKAPETYERRKPLGSFLAVTPNLAGALADGLGAPGKKKLVEVERIREVPDAQDGDEDQDGPSEPSRRRR